MKINISILLATVVLLTGQVRAMQPQSPHDRDLQVRIADFEAASQTLSEAVSRIAGAIDEELNASRLQMLIDDLNAQKQQLTTGINQALRELDSVRMSERDRNGLSMTCYNLLKQVKDIHFVELESRLEFLNAAHPRQSPNRSNRSDALIAQQYAIEEQIAARKRGEQDRPHRRRDEHARPAPRNYPEPAPAPRETRPVVQQQVAMIAMPQDLQKRAVHHVHVTPLYDFCCGYNALKSACDIEASCGFNNPFSNTQAFRSTCMNYLGQINPLDPVYNHTMEALAQILALQQGHLLHKRNNSIVIAHSTGVTYRYNDGDSQATIERKQREAYYAKNKQTFDRIKDRLRASNDEYKVVHFFCNIRPYDDIGHMILITFVENATGRGLYVFDNLNHPIRPTSQIAEATETRHFVDYLCDVFNVSERNRFQGPLIPLQRN